MTLTGTAVADNMKIDGDRLWDSLMEMAKIGPGVAGGNNRQTLTDAEYVPVPFVDAWVCVWWTGSLKNNVGLRISIQYPHMYRNSYYY